MLLIGSENKNTNVLVSGDHAIFVGDFSLRCILPHMGGE